MSVNPKHEHPEYLHNTGLVHKSPEVRGGGGTPPEQPTKLWASARWRWSSAFETLRGRAPCGALAGGLAQSATVGRAEGANDAPVHESEEVIDVAVVAFDPHVPARGRFDQLSGYRNAVTGMLHAPSQRQLGQYKPQ